MRALIRLIDDLHPSFLLDGRAPRRAGDYVITAGGGVSLTPAAVPGLSGGGRGVSFDGTDDYLATDYKTRRNLCTNPSFEVNASGWSSGSGALTRDTGWSKYGSASGRRTGTVTNNDVSTFSDYFAVAAGSVLQLAAVIKAASGYTATGAGNGPRFQIQWSTDGVNNNNGNSIAASTAALSAAEERAISYSATAPAGTTSARVRVICGITTGSQTVDTYIDAVLFEQAASAGRYFDGSGYVNAAGVWVPSDGIECGWRGTAHASASEKGPYAGGTVRTFVFVGQRGVGTGFMGLFSSSNVGLNIPRLYLGDDTGGPSTPNTVYFEAVNGGTALSFAPIGSTFSAFTLALEFSDPANTAEARFNGVSMGSQALTDQFNSPGSNLELGHLAGSFPFGGLGAGFAIYPRALTARDHKAIAKTALAGRFG